MTGEHLQLPKARQPKLKPCPFCGSAPDPLWSVNGWLYVRCSNPLCGGEIIRPCGLRSVSDGVIHNIAGRWNNRVAAPLRETNKKGGK